VKASLLSEVLKVRWPLMTIDTGQHYDYELNALLYEQMGIAQPQYCLEVGSGDHATQTAQILTRSAELLIENSPWAVVVIGDTNSTLGCALAAVKLRIPVIHVEAGMRALDFMMAEEINRRAVDAVSSLLCAPSASSAARLAREFVGGEIVATGDIAHDVLLRHVRRTGPAHTIPQWPVAPGVPFVYSTLHRAELTDDIERLRGVLVALGDIGVPIVFPAHPRTRAVLEREGLLDTIPPSVHLLRPLGYLESLAAVRDASAVVTDSGGVQREAYWLGTPCVTVRTETEWTETVAEGANQLVPPAQAPKVLARIVQGLLGPGGKPQLPPPHAYGAGDASLRIRDAIADFERRFTGTRGD
jgi:UDP-GlcNAc3NAcA epimerase